MAEPRRLVPIASLLILAAAASSCSAPTADIRVRDAWAWPAPAAGGTTAVYLRMTNDSRDPERLLGGRTAEADSLELHRTMMAGDAAQMMTVDGIDLPPGETVALAPGGYHIMLVGLASPLEPGDQVELTLKFEHAGDVYVVAQVRQP